MQPNKDNKEDLLFRCECGGEYLEIYKEDNGVWFNSIHYPKNIWQILQWWFKHKKLWNYDMFLSSSDIKALRDQLDKYIDSKSNKKK